MPEACVKRILSARIYDLVQETPIDRMHFLSKALGCNVLVKREDLQSIFSFKIRGAYNKLLSLTAAERARGVIAASAGNHAQGVALAANRLGIHATIVMPVTTPQIKVQSVRERGAETVLHGDCFDDACIHAMALQAEHGFVFVHPYDDPAVIAGQGTIGMEILRQHSGDLDAVFVPVGGGGLIAGVATYIKYLRPEVRVIGVEAEDSACLKAALAAGARVRLPNVGIFADGVAVAQIGKETFRLARETVDEVVTVSTDAICAAVKDLFDDTRSIAEPAGALSVAGLKRYAEEHRLQGATLLAIESGANVNFDRLRYISERTELGEKTELFLGVTIPERAGSLRDFRLALGGHDITEFNYRCSDADKAQIFVGVHLDRTVPGGAAGLAEGLRAQGYAVLDMSDNELAKEHVCHMVGGRAPELRDERVFRFEFPERPGALLDFLNAMTKQWTITVFHYRKQGASYGQVLMGLQVPEEDRAALDAFLTRVNYRHTEETDNPAYRLFLG